jgi:nucleoside-diphosphate-sugar epimerase
VEQTILIAGALGIVGRAAVEHFSAREGWNVIGLSRRAPDFPTEAQFVSVDLRDRDSTMSGLAEAGPVTHLVYAALYEEADLVAGWRAERQMRVNLDMLTHVLDALAVTSPELTHITLMQGTKAYGHHVERMPIPGKEQRPRHSHQNFYWLQEDLLRDREPDAPWSWTVLRPQVMLGWALGGQMNVLAAAGAHAAIMRELGRPLSYPGGGYAVKEATDARLLAEAMEWAATTPACRNEIYNITNGDSFTYHDIWPVFAEHFSVPLDEPRPRVLADEMPVHADLWDRIAHREGLRYDLETTVGRTGWQFLDYLVSEQGSGRWSSVLSTIKARQHGFGSCIDTANSIHAWLDRMQAARILPAS